MPTTTKVFDFRWNPFEKLTDIEIDVAVSKIEAKKLYQVTASKNAAEMRAKFKVWRKFVENEMAN